MLKNILSLLLSRFYSKQESELVGHQAMPSPSNTVITPSIKIECTTWSDAHIGIAPADGYLYVTGRTTNTDGFLQISSDTTEIAATTFGNTDKDIRLLFPFAKGQAMKVTAKSLKNIFLRFSSSIGGGIKKLLLQGGVLCRLKHLYSSLRRSFWLARRKVFRIGRTPTLQIVLPFSFHLQKTILFIHPQATDGCRCTLGTRGLLTSQLILTQRIIAQSCLAFCLPLPVGTATFIEYVKALMSRSQSQLLYRKDGLCFFRLINSAVGGASC